MVCAPNEQVGYPPTMRTRVYLVSRRFVDLRRVASQMCRTTGVRMSAAL